MKTYNTLNSKPASATACQCFSLEPLNTYSEGSVCVQADMYISSLLVTVAL